MSQLNGTQPTSQQDAAIGAIIDDVNNNSKLEPVTTGKFDLTDDPKRPSISLAALSATSRLTIQDLYGRAHGRKLLIKAPFRTAPELRRIFRDQIDECLAPKRGTATATPAVAALLAETTPLTPAPAVPSSALVPVDRPFLLGTPPSAPVEVAPTRIAHDMIRKTISLYRAGHYTADEAFFQIESNLSR
jgi:hypothetical protein